MIEIRQQPDEILVIMDYSLPAHPTVDFVNDIAQHLQVKNSHDVSWEAIIVIAKTFNAQKIYNGDHLNEYLSSLLITENIRHQGIVRLDYRMSIFEIMSRVIGFLPIRMRRRSALTFFCNHSDRFMVKMLATMRIGGNEISVKECKLFRENFFERMSRVAFELFAREDLKQ